METTSSRVFSWGGSEKLGTVPVFQTQVVHAAETVHRMMGLRELFGVLKGQAKIWPGHDADLGQAVYKVFALALLQDSSRQSLSGEDGNQTRKGSPHLQVIGLICNRDCGFYALLRHKIPECFGLRAFRFTSAWGLWLTPIFPGFPGFRV